MKILVTGAAGFIGAATAVKLAETGVDVIGIDNINEYYDIRLKYARLEDAGFQCDSLDMPFCVYYHSKKYPNYKFIRLGIDNREAMDNLFREECFDKVINLAAQAGVRYSIKNPYSYTNSNIVGFMNILECCRHNHVKKLVFASSSSVYGLNNKTPFNEADRVDTPVSLYAASKKANELMAHAYSKLYGIPAVALRYFTVYGPWGRPDMAPMLFTKSISSGKEISVFNNGNLSRDFTYIDDIVEGTLRVLDWDMEKEKCPNGIPFEIFNIGGSHPVKLMDFISELEQTIGKKAIIKFTPMQEGDVYHTYADVSKLKAAVGYTPQVSLHEGIGHFIKWFKSEKNPLKD